MRKGEFELVTSYILRYESSANPYESRRDAINQFIVVNTSIYVGIENKMKIENAAYEIMKTGLNLRMLVIFLPLSMRTVIILYQQTNDF